MEQVYELVRECMAAAARHFPHASKLVPNYSPQSASSSVLVEVWVDGRATVVPMTPNGPAVRS